MPRIHECTLSNDLSVFFRSKVDVDILSRELLQDDNLYLRNGITIRRWILKVRKRMCLQVLNRTIGFESVNWSSKFIMARIAYIEWNICFRAMDSRRTASLCFPAWTMCMSSMPVDKNPQR